MTEQQHPITPPPPHLLKKFSAQAQDETKKRNGAGYLKTFATLCIEWAMNSKTTPNDRQIRSSEIEPPPELVRQWMERTEYDENTWFYESYIATEAAQWGADQELDACCDWLLGETEQSCINELRAYRRPKPPSQAEEALQSLDHLNEAAQSQMDTTEVVDNIRSALKRLQELENNND